MSVLVDSDLIISGMRSSSLVLDFLDSFAQRGLSISVVTLAEVFEGAFHTDDPVQHLSAAREFLDHYIIVDVTDPVAETFARLRAALRHQGNSIADMDLLIAATAITYDLTLLTRNTRHFSRVPGLHLQHPAS